MAAPMTAAEAETLQAKSAGARRQLRVAMVVRAVNDAKQGDEMGDTVARDDRVRRAVALAAELSSQEAGRYLADIEEWRSEATRNSATATQYVARDRYESALARISDGQRAAFVDACVEAHGRLSRAEEALTSRLESFLFDVLENDARTALLDSDIAAKQEGAIAALGAVEQALSRATPWKQSSRWRSLHSLVEKEGKEHGRRALRRASALAGEDRLDEAIELAAIAVRLGDAVVQNDASRLTSQWQAELKVRADQHAEAEQWRAIELVENDPAALFELRKQLAEFAKRFPRSGRLDAARALVERTDAEAGRQFAGKVEAAAKLIEGGQYKRAAAELDALRESARQAPQREAIQGLLDKIQKVEQRALALLDNLSPIVRKMASPKEILQVRDAVRKVYEVNPEHPLAQELERLADARARPYAAGRIKSAQVHKKFNPQKAKQLCWEAIDLDPNGPAAREARQILDGMDQ
jgi:hypothetical protein